MEALGERTSRGVDARRLLHQPRGVEPALRIVPDSASAAARRMVRPHDALSVDWRAHTGSGRRSRRIFSRRSEPHRHQARPERDGGPGPFADRRPQSPGRTRQGGPDHPHGGHPRRRRAARPGRGREAWRASRPLGVRPDAREYADGAVWPEDARLRQRPPRSGNDLRGTRRLRDLARRRSFRAHGRGRDRVHRRRPGHHRARLDRNYATACDPRLNYRQALEMGFRIAKRLGPQSPR